MLSAGSHVANWRPSSQANCRNFTSYPASRSICCSAAESAAAAAAAILDAISGAGGYLEQRSRL